jgi:hypothetical protein
MGNYGKQLNYLEEILSIKTPPSKEYIVELHRNGARFREKTVKGKQYLSARINGKEIGLGLYTQDLRKLISELKKSEQKSIETITDKTCDHLATYTVKIFPSPLRIPVKVEFSRGEVDLALFDIKFERAKVKIIDCEYSFNGFCQYWDFIEDSKRFKSIYREFDIEDYFLPKLSNHAQQGEQSRDMLRVTELLCFDCEKYQPRKK